MARHDELLPCPFCGEAPQVLSDGHTVAHACMVLGKEIRTTPRGWNTRWHPPLHEPPLAGGAARIFAPGA